MVWALGAGGGPVAATLPPFEAATVLTGWSFDGLSAGLTLTAAVLYLIGVRALARRGRRWPPARTAVFLAGLAVIVVATQSAIGAYDTTLFWTHAVQHVLLGIVTPLLLVLGLPVTLVLQAGDRSIQTGMLRMLRSRPAVVMTHPVTTWLLFAGSMFVVYFSALYEWSLQNEFVHQALHIHMVATGCLFFVLVTGAAPLRRVPAHPARILLVLLLVPVHAVLGVAVMGSVPVLGGDFYRTLGRDWGPSLAQDQRIGGAILWAGGEIVMLGLLILLVARWFDHEERAGRRLDRRLDRKRSASDQAAD